jgi:hypothetical protein
MTMDYIQMITTNFVIIVGIIIYIFGVIGNILNICVFTIWSFPRRNLNEHNRANNSSLYLLTSSCANFIQIIYPLLTRIIFDGFQRAKTKENVFYTCQFRYYVLHTSDLISLTCICMATLDRYLISSREVRLRRLSTTKQQTKLLILLIICLFGIHSIPLIIYYDVSNVGNCIINSREYLYYYLCVFQIFLHGIFPILFLSIFGILTYKQLKMLHGNLNGDKQLSRMLLLSCIALLISSIPYCIQNIYSVIFIDFNEELSSYALLFYYISAILFFSNAILSFYIFFISTPNFRKQVKKILQCKIFIRTLGNNRVNAISNVNNGQ